MIIYISIIWIFLIITIIGAAYIIYKRKEFVKLNSRYEMLLQEFQYLACDNNTLINFVHGEKYNIHYTKGAHNVSYITSIVK